MINNKKAQEATTITWVVATFIILMILIIYIVYTGITYVQRGGVSLEIKNRVNPSSSLLQTKEFITSIEKIETVETQDATTLDLIEQVSKYFIDNNEQYIEDDLTLPKNRPFLRLEQYPKERMAYIITNLLKNTNQYKNCGEGYKCYPMFFIRTQNDKYLVKYSPGSKIAPLIADPRNSHYIRVPLSDDSLIDVNVSWSGPVPENMHILKISQITVTDPRAAVEMGAAPSGGYLSLGVAMRDSIDSSYAQSLENEGKRKEDLTYILDSFSDEELRGLIKIYNDMYWVQEIDTYDRNDPQVRKWFEPIRTVKVIRLKIFSFEEYPDFDGMESNRIDWFRDKIKKYHALVKGGSN